MGSGKSKVEHTTRRPPYRASQNTGNKRQVKPTPGKKKIQKVAVLEKGYKQRLRENLRNASAGNDIEQLEKCMQGFVNNNMEDGGDYSEGKERLQFLLLRKELRDACLGNHPVPLKNAIAKVEASPHKTKLKPMLDRAYLLRSRHGEENKMKHDISNMNHATISEIRSYNKPPVGVHETMIATYMILGYPESHLTEWKNITALMGRQGKDKNLLNEVKNVDEKKISRARSETARNYLSGFTLEEVRARSNGAAAFFGWSARILKHDPNKKITAR